MKNPKFIKRSTLSVLGIVSLFAFSLHCEAAPEKGSVAETNKKIDWAFVPDPALPNVLILGDSISIGYTLQVRELLKGKANVYRPVKKGGKAPENCSGTTTGKGKVDRWLKGHDWAVIHFNWGLHDLKHVEKAGTHLLSNNPEDPTQATVEQYSKNMEEIVDKLEATEARLVFATTTPVAPNTLNPLRDEDAPGKYNKAALKLMKEKGIRVNDLFALCEANLNEWQLPSNVHFKKEGSVGMAKQVAEVISEELDASGK